LKKQLSLEPDGPSARGYGAGIIEKRENNFTLRREIGKDDIAAGEKI
jgi:hypothetical protein